MSELSRRQFVAGGAALGATAALGGPLLLRSAGARAAPPTAPRLSYGPDARRSMWLSWSTLGSVSGQVAELGVDDTYGHPLAIETRTVAGYDVQYHHALVAGLEPGTTYQWRLRHDGAEPVAGSLVTAAPDRVPFRFVAFGDQGAGGVAESVGTVIAALRPAPALAFLVGDLSYASKTGAVLPSVPGVTALDDTVWDAWLDVASTAGAASFPWLGGVGNHEIEDGRGELGYDGYLARVALPGNGPDGVPTAWTARYGNVAFVNLDGNDASFEITRNLGWTGGAQDAWLDGTLAGLRADPSIDWIVVGFHHCAYCTNAVHASDGGVRARWEPLFDRHRVDLVVNGHNHCYERSHPIRAGAPVHEVSAGDQYDSALGTTYLTAGGGGQQGYPTFLAPASYVSVAGGVRLPELAPWSAYRFPSNSVVYADVGPGEPGGATTMTVVALDAAGAELERVTLVRARQAAPLAAVGVSPPLVGSSGPRH